MGADEDFAARLRLMFQRIGLSRGRAAALLGVDKSLVGRWWSGAVRPSDHNLSRITALAAEHIDGFTALDWHRDLQGFARLIGLDPSAAISAAKPAEAMAGLPLACLAQARSETQRRGAAYEGFWRTSRPSVIMEGRVFHDYGMIRIAANGLLEVTMGGSSLGFTGWALPLEGNLFAILEGAVGFTPLFLIFRGVALPKATLLDGIVLLAALDAARTPASVPILLERVGDLSGDRAADEARSLELSAEHSSAGAEEVPDTVLRHLVRDFGPAAANSGGDLFLTVSALGRLSRGATASGQLEG
jgi:transcriptional regulator with XRE-family HTH domain